MPENLNFLRKRSRLIKAFVLTQIKKKYMLFYMLTKRKHIKIFYHPIHTIPAPQIKIVTPPSTCT